MYAVIDLETTGLNPDRHDRIVEIAVVHVDCDGEITREWTTLINPHRDLGPQHIHGISAADARRAPSFAETAPAIVELLSGRVVVAHNLAFDAPFLAHQFRQIGLDAPVGIETGLCTMVLAATFLPQSARSLAACCAAASVPLEHAHCALDDTRAAAMLLGHYIRASGPTVPWPDTIRGGQAARWPVIPATTGFAPVARTAPGVERPSFLGRLVDALPRVVSPPESDRYLAVLDRALAGGQISATDGDALVDLAAQLGLARDDVLRLHRDYLSALGAAAVRAASMGANDPTDSDVAELRSLASVLGLPPDTADTVLGGAIVAGGLEAAPIPRPARTRFELSPGDAVAFSGQTREPREALEERARRAGLRVAPHVTRDVVLVVAADVDTMSIKARTARDYGVPIVGPEAFDGFLAAIQSPNPADTAAASSQAPIPD